MLYAAVGFGGGSTYNALLVLADFDFRYIPIIALSCNIVVVLGNCLRYQLHDLIPWRFSIPLIMLSVPASFIGGSIQVSEIIFMLLLGMGLQSFSMHPSAIPEIKKIILNSDTNKFHSIIKRILNNDAKKKELIDKINS